MQTYYVDYKVTRLAFIASLSAALAGMLVAVQMTLFSYVLAARLIRDSETANISPYSTSLRSDFSMQKWLFYAT